MKADDYKTLIGCTTIFFLLVGGPRVAPILFVESLVRFETNREEASFPFVLFYLVRNLSGPLVGYLEQIFGLKYVVLFGAIMATISVGLCFFAEDVIAISILWGVMTGLGVGLASHLIPSLLNHQFPKHQSKANGFAYSSVGLGVFVLSPIINICIHWYGFSGSFLILSGIMANSIPAALLLKNLKNNTSTNKKIHLEGKANKVIVEDLIIARNHFFSDIKKLDNTERSLKKTSKDRDSSEIEVDSKIYSETTIENTFISNKNMNHISKKKILSLHNFRVLIDPAYIIILILHAGYLFVLIVIWTIILDFLRDKCIPQNLEIYFLMVLPLSDLFGRLSSGFFIDKHFLTPSTLTSIANFLVALQLIAFIFFYNYIILMICVILISIIQGSMLILQVALIHESIETEKKTLAMTSRYILYAPFCPLSSPMIGYFRGTQNSYDKVFYILIAISMFCGFVACFIPQMVKRRRITD